jgi:hypothetical protein
MPFRQGVDMNDEYGSVRDPCSFPARVATTTKAYGRNSARDGGIETTTLDLGERSSALSAAFEISAPMPEGPSARAVDASFANLAKANEANRRRRAGGSGRADG